jgi:hypothetical protein
MGQALGERSQRPCLDEVDRSVETRGVPVSSIHAYFTPVSIAFLSSNRGRSDMSKVYGIFCDASLDNLLVGTGGTAGHLAQRRVGWHLPGGTIDGVNFQGRSTPVPLDQLHGQLWREVGEEFGAQRARLLDRFMARPLDKIGLSLDGHSVCFVVCALDVPLREFVGRVAEGAGGGADSSFEFVQAVGLLDALDEFRANASTGWFASGVKQVSKHKALLLS